MSTDARCLQEMTLKMIYEKCKWGLNFFVEQFNRALINPELEIFLWLQRQILQIELEGERKFQRKNLRVPDFHVFKFKFIDIGKIMQSGSERQTALRRKCIWDREKPDKRHTLAARNEIYIKIIDGCAWSFLPSFSEYRSFEMNVYFSLYFFLFHSLLLLRFE